MPADSSSVGAAYASPPTPVAVAAPSRAVPVNAKVGASDGRSAASAVTAPRSVTLRPPEKADVGFDSREMRRQLEEAIQQLDEQSRRNGRDLNFRIDDVVDRTVITVRSKHTGEVVRQIPSETVMKLAHSIEEMKGLLLNEQA